MSALPSYQAILSSVLNQPAPASIAGKNLVQQTDDANQANYTRGQNILGLLASAGNEAKQENQDAFAKQSANIQQSAITRGLSNTTVVPNLLQGANTQLMRSNAAVDEHSAGQLANMLNSFSAIAPNPALFSNLLETGANRPQAQGQMVSPGALTQQSMGMGNSGGGVARVGSPNSYPTPAPGAVGSGVGGGTDWYQTQQPDMANDPALQNSLDQAMSYADQIAAMFQ